MKVDVSGAQIYCESAGEGEAVVLVPGFASGMWSWAWQTNALAEYFRVITFDPRGLSGSTDDGSRPLSIEFIADDVAAVLDALEIDKAHILGLSFGGFVAQEFTLKYPDRVKKLVLASTSFGGVNHVSSSQKVLTAFSSTEGLNSGDRIRQYLTVSFSPDFAVSDPETVEEFCRLREENFVPEDVYLGQLRSAFAFDAESRLPQIEAETLVVTGDVDTIVPMQNSQNLAAAIPNAELVVIEGGSHMAFVSQADKFNAIVRDFLKRS
ncbi:MAG: alpha/beta hydrolase [Acidobacteria bacterium]|nr:alpha/beta hydrolase [Acidobacteriota bacterium]